MEVSQLQTKLDQTSSQVNAIISNFERVHTDIQDLKNQYLQSKVEQAQTSIEEDSSQNVQLSSKMNI